jgi:hypothetical protein
MEPITKLLFLERWAKVAFVREAPIMAVIEGSPIIRIWHVCPEKERFQYFSYVAGLIGVV